MESFEEGVARDSERATLGTKVTVLACTVAVLVVVTLLGLQGRYIDVEQAPQVSEHAPTAVAIHAEPSNR